MADAIKDVIGEFNIAVVQFNTKSVALSFKFKDLDTELFEPWDLKQFESIEMQVRYQPSVGKKLYYTFALGDDLSISGQNDEVLLMDFDAGFYQNRMKSTYYYDALFTYKNNGGVKTIFGGKIEVNLRTTTNK